MNIIQEMHLEHETPGALRYQIVDANGNFLNDPKESLFGPKIYIRKTALDSTPKRIRVTIEILEE